LRARNSTAYKVEAANRFESALSAAYNGTLGRPRPPPPEPDPGGKFTVITVDYGPGERGPPRRNHFDAVFEAVAAARP
jgi:hypothetical protein